MTFEERCYRAYIRYGYAPAIGNPEDWWEETKTKKIFMDIVDIVRREIDLEERALAFAKAAHESINQKRKYSGEDYIVHPIAVAEVVRSVRHTPTMIAAALCHDVVEDTSFTLEDITEELGYDVAELVYWLTDVSKPSDGNRKVRKEIDRQHIAKAPAAAKTIKLADLFDNTLTIRELDPDFWRVYRHEKLRLLEVLKEGDPTLWARAAAQCEKA